MSASSMELVEHKASNYEATQKLMETFERVSDSHYGVAIIDGSSEHKDLAKSVEQEVFNDMFGLDSEKMAEEYDHLDDYSKFILVFDQENSLPVATIRLIEYSEERGLKSLNDIEKGPWGLTAEDVIESENLDLEKTWDIGTLAVMPEYRGGAIAGSVASAVYHELYTQSTIQGIEDWVAIIDTAVLDYMNQLGIALRPIENAKSINYLGSECTPMTGNVAEIGSELEKHPASESVFIHGENLQDFTYYSR